MRIARGGFFSAICARTVFRGFGTIRTKYEVRSSNEELRRQLTFSSFLMRTSNFEKRERLRAPIKSPNSCSRSAEQSLFLQLLTINAERCPRNCRQPLFADRVPAVRAGAEDALFDSVEGFVDQHQKIALTVGERKVELFRIGAGGFVRQVLNTIIGQRVAGCFVTLKGIEQLVVFFPKCFDLRRIRVGFGLGSCHGRAGSPYL